MNSETIPIVTNTLSNQALAKLTEPRETSIAALASLGAEHIVQQQKNHYLEAERSGVIQYLTSITETYGQAGANGWLLVVNDVESKLTITLNVQSSDHSIEVKVKTAEGRELIVLTDRAYDDRRLNLGKDCKGMWLHAIKAAEERLIEEAKHQANLKQRARTSSAIADAVADI